MYEKLLEEAHQKGLTVLEKYPFQSSRIRGLCCDDTIALSAQIDTTAERTVVLCEELAHATHSYGDILHDPRMERRTRERIFDRLIGPAGLVNAYLAGCRESWEFADWLNIPESFLIAAIKNYRQRFGVMTNVLTDAGLFSLQFEPTLRVRRIVRSTDKQQLRDSRKKEISS